MIIGVAEESITNHVYESFPGKWLAAIMLVSMVNGAQALSADVSICAMALGAMYSVSYSVESQP